MVALIREEVRKDRPSTHDTRAKRFAITNDRGIRRREEHRLPPNKRDQDCRTVETPQGQPRHADEERQPGAGLRTKVRSPAIHSRERVKTQTRVSKYNA